MPSEAAGSDAETNWEARYQQQNTPWEEGFAAPPLVDWLTRNTLAGRVLVPGCGTGHDVRALAQAGAEPVGVDIAPSAIQLARSHPPVGAEVYRLDDFFALPPDLCGTFNWVFEHTCFCAIDPALRPTYVEAARSALKPDGRLLAIFYLDPSNPEDGPPFGVNRGELDRLFAPWFTLVGEYVPTVAYDGREGRELVRVYRLS